MPDDFARPDLSNVRLTPSVYQAEAANHVDAEFRRRQADLFTEHSNRPASTAHGSAGPNCS